MSTLENAFTEEAAAPPGGNEPAETVSEKHLQERLNALSRIFKLVSNAKEEWEQTMDCIGDMVILTDHNRMIKRCNKAFKEFLSRSYEEILGKDCAGLLAKKGMTVPDGANVSMEVFCPPEERWFVLNTYPVGDRNGDLEFGTVITFHDMTELKRVTRTLETTNRKIEENRLGLQLALDELSALIQKVEKDQGLGVRFHNPHLVKCHVAKNCGKNDCPCHGKEPMRCWQVAGTHCGGKVQGNFAKKIDNCVECSVFQTAAPNPIFIIGEHFNNMMHILEMKNAQLEQAYKELKSTQAKILQQEKMASIGQLAAGVAHEINNPMGFIASNLSTLGKFTNRLTEFIDLQGGIIASCGDDEAKKRIAESRAKLKLDYILDDTGTLIAESLDGADRVKTIVQNLKNFSRVDQAEARLADINECLETTINIVWNELKYKAALHREYGNIPLTRCHPQQLNQVFMNLLVNASHAIEAQGDITVRTWEEGDSIHIAVSDTGMGIAEQNLSRIFEPFFTTKAVGKGTGLGLSITYDIIKKHEGDITVNSEVGKGTTFTVRVPIVREE